MGNDQNKQDHQQQGGHKKGGQQQQSHERHLVVLNCRGTFGGKEWTTIYHHLWVPRLQTC